MDQTVEDKLRARAHAIWEGEGRPEGRELQHWEQAARELAEAEAGPPSDGEEHARIVAPTVK